MVASQQEVQDGKPQAQTDRALPGTSPVSVGRSDNFLLSGDRERPICGPWRVQVLCELLAEDRIACLEWPTGQLASEARLRGIAVPS